MARFLHVFLVRYGMFSEDRTLSHGSLAVRALCSFVVLLSIPAGTAFAATDGVGGPSPTAQASSSSLPEAPPPQPEESLRCTPVRVLKDQGAIWTSPLRIRPHDLLWLAPLAAATGAAIATDRRAIVSEISHDPSFNQANINASNVMIGGLIAAPVVWLGAGYLREDEHARETGILGGEAILDGLVLEQGMKLIFWRERPTVDGARGRFFQSSAGVDSSFPSSHSVLAWSSAAVIAGEYPSPWVQLGVYSVAAGVSVTRVLGQEHFPSDVLVGSAAGWLVGHYVYKVHHRHRRGVDH